MREISLDTETTGLKPAEGHRIVEIGCVEMINRIPTGREYHCYINPERDMPQVAEEIHGLSEEFLSDKPVFGAIVDDFLEFIGDAQLVIHNAKFDIGFINAELTHVRKPNISIRRAFDTLHEARARFPGSPASLDALCRRFDIDISARTQHGALLDAQLLAEMYLELMGGAQEGLEFGDKKKNAESVAGVLNIQKTEFKEPRPHNPSDEEETAHDEFIKKIPDALWNEG